MEPDSEPPAASSAPEDGAGTADATSTPALQQSLGQDVEVHEPSAGELSNSADAQALHGASQQSSEDPATPLESSLGAAPIKPVQRKRRGRPSKAVSSQTQPITTQTPRQPARTDQASKPGTCFEEASRDFVHALQDPSHHVGSSSKSLEGAAAGDDSAAASMPDQQDQSSASLKDPTQSHLSSPFSSAQVETHSNNSQEQQDSSASPHPSEAEDFSSTISTSSSSEGSEDDDPWASLNGEPEPVTSNAAAHSGSHEGRAQPPGGIRLMDLSNLVPSRRIRGVMQTAERSWAATQAQARASLPQAQQPTYPNSSSSASSGMSSAILLNENSSLCDIFSKTPTKSPMALAKA